MPHHLEGLRLKGLSDEAKANLVIAITAVAIIVLSTLVLVVLP